jgi:hypothetical protein
MLKKFDAGQDIFEQLYSSYAPLRHVPTSHQGRCILKLPIQHQQPDPSDELDAAHSLLQLARGSKPTWGVFIDLNYL